jgi:flagellar hook assembly protein FlgD
MIRYTIPSASVVLMQVFDAAGARARRLLDDDRPAGHFSMLWDGRDDRGRAVPAGVYSVRIVTLSGTSTARVVVVR